MSDIIFTTNVPGEVGGFGDRILGMAACDLLAAKLGRNLKIDLNSDFPFFSAFCPQLEPHFCFRNNENRPFPPIANLRDQNLTQGNINILIDWCRRNPSASIKLSINQLPPWLIEFLGFSDGVPTIVMRFARRFLFPEYTYVGETLSNFSSLVDSRRSLGIHVRTLSFNDGQEHGFKGNIDLEQIAVLVDQMFPGEDLIYVCSDSPVVRNELLAKLSPRCPKVYFDIIPRHVDQIRLKQSDVPQKLISLHDHEEKFLRSVGDWFVLRHCKKIIGTTGNYAATAAYSLGRYFVRYVQ
jgi:hypothetical protein